MPNWKKIALSGSSPEFSSLNVDNAITASNLNITSTGSFSRVEADSIDLDRLSLTSTQTTVPPLQLTANSLQDGVGALRIDGSQADIFLNPSTATHTTVTFAVNNDQRLAFGMDNGSDFYITRRTGGTWYDDTFVLDRDTGLLSLGYGLSVTGGVTGSSFSGSFVGDGSGLTGITTDVGEVATVADSFTNVTSKVVTHGFGTKNVIVSVYNNNDEVIVPSSITTTDDNSVTITLDTLTSGRVVVAKGGHIVTSQTYRETLSGSSSYTINHNLGQDYCLVQAYSSSRKQVLPADIESLTTGSLVITFDNTFDGVVVVKS